MYDKFHAYLGELESGFKKLSALLHEKLRAVEKFNLEKLDGIMKEEQAYVLLSRSFDKNIKDYKERLGLEGEKLSDIVEELPEAERARFREAYRTLKAALDEVKALNEKCQGLIEERLHRLDKAIKEFDRSAGTPYGDIKKPSDSPTLMNRQI
ncbi:MAG: flagellar protein FlgN [Oscillospiraceae bacterium]|jgi:dsDNA-specific endonuclease/ATPase MutS2|nr:flagellar protein FlgN [Oscillospiraceae bacterium]